MRIWDIHPGYLNRLILEDAAIYMHSHTTGQKT